MMSGKDEYYRGSHLPDDKRSLFVQFRSFPSTFVDFAEPA